MRLAYKDRRRAPRRIEDRERLRSHEVILISLGMAIGAAVLGSFLFVLWVIRGH